MAINDYQGAKGAIDVVERDFNKFIKVYNDLGSAVTNGDVYHLSYERDADSLTVAGRPTLVACATTSVPRQTVVVNNTILGESTIADQAWGYVQIQGYCPKIKVASTVAIDDYLQGANGSQEAADDGTSQTTDSFGIALSAYSSGYAEGLLFGISAIIG
jgi:hypothetical protein